MSLINGTSLAKAKVLSLYAQGQISADECAQRIAVIGRITLMDRLMYKLWWLLGLVNRRARCRAERWLVNDMAARFRRIRKGITQWKKQQASE